MTTPPSKWLDKAMSLAITMLAIAVMLYLAAQLIAAVLPILIGIAIVILVGFIGWTLVQYWRSRW